MSTDSGRVVRGGFEFPHDAGDHEKIIRYVEQVMDTSRAYRVDLERNAMRNILFYSGIQWIQFDRQFRTWRPVAFKRKVPRPMTNKFAALVNGVVSQLVSAKPPVTAGPGSQDPDDVAAGWAGDKILQIIEREADIRRLRPLLAKWLTLTGSAFLVSNYDADPKAGTEFIQHYQCAIGQEMMDAAEASERGGICQEHESEIIPAFSDQGEAIGDEYPVGRHYTELQNVFTSYFDYESPFVDDSPHFMINEGRNREWIEAKYGEKVLEDLSSERDRDAHSTYLESLAYLTMGSFRLLSTGGHRPQEKVRVRRIWIRPEYTKGDKKGGIYAVVAGKTVLEARDWYSHDEEGKAFLPVTHIRFDYSPGRILGKSRCDDLAVKQEQRNRLESIVELHSRRMANSSWLLPEGVGVSRISGEQGTYIRYTALAGVPPPTKVSGDNIPQYLMLWFGQIDAEMDDIMGSYEVSRGQVPEGVSAYAALEFLDQKSRQGQSSIMEEWQLGHLLWAKHNLDLWREYADKERIINTGGPGAWAIEKFNSASLKGGVDLQLEIGENRPTSSVGRMARLDQATRLGAINVMDPFERFRLLQALGLPEMMEDYKVELQAAHKKVDAFANSVIPPPPAPWDNHMLMAAVLRRFIYSDQFAALDPEIQATVVEHMGIHFQFLQEQQMQMGPGQVAPQIGPAGGSEGSAKGDNQSGSEQELRDREAQGASPDVR